MSKKVTITQIRSKAGRIKEVYRTLDALGLGRIGKTKTIVLNPATEGMIKKVGYLLKVEDAK